jgi:hypothetical protein
MRRLEAYRSELLCGGKARTTSGQPTVRDLGALHSVSAPACACPQHTFYVYLSRYSVIEKFSGAS